MLDSNRCSPSDNIFYSYSDKVLDTLLKDRTTKKNIIWASDDYRSFGPGFLADDTIKKNSLTHQNSPIIKTRIMKTNKHQTTRTKKMAEVFTPSWICNNQNNLIDNAWFGHTGVFNISLSKSWKTNSNKIDFTNVKGKNWTDYIKSKRLEIACGEAPYLVSRKDMISGDTIPIEDRIGLLDRKMRVINENTSDEEDWFYWTTVAYQSIYGFELQGDSLFLARQNLINTFVDNITYKFGRMPKEKELIKIATIISWNIWQMDGIKYVVPNSCYNQEIIFYSLFGEEEHFSYCQGCIENDPHSHNGIYSKIMDWETNREKKYVSFFE